MKGRQNGLKKNNNNFRVVEESLGLSQMALAMETKTQGTFYVFHGCLGWRAWI